MTRAQRIERTPHEGRTTSGAIALIRAPDRAHCAARHLLARRV
jgi:hypothetical protein